jgi:spermidine synthase
MKATITLASCLTPDGAPMVLQQHDGQHYLKIGGVPLMSTTASFSEQRMAELACATLPSRPHILIGGLGFGFTLRRVLELAPPDANVDVAELLPEIVAWNRDHLPHVNGTLLNDPRVRIHVGDVHDLLDGSRRHHAILLDVDNSPDPLVQQGNARLYHRGGLLRIKAALQPRGRVVFWSAHRDKHFADSLARVFPHVECIGAKAYPQAKKITHTLFVADRA